MAMTCRERGGGWSEIEVIAIYFRKSTFSSAPSHFRYEIFEPPVERYWAYRDDTTGKWQGLIRELFDEVTWVYVYWYFFHKM